MQIKGNLVYIICICLIILLGVFYSTTIPSKYAIALEPTPSDDEINAIAADLFCPVCENVPLDVCDTEACRQWRNLIKEMLAEGKTESEIKEYFSENYGVRVLSEPPKEGFFWIAYVVPPIAFLLGSYFLIKALNTWKKIERNHITEDENDPTPSNDDEYQKKFLQEVEKRR